MVRKRGRDDENTQPGNMKRSRNFHYSIQAKHDIDDVEVISRLQNQLTRLQNECSSMQSKCHQEIGSMREENMALQTKLQQQNAILLEMHNRLLSCGQPLMLGAGAAPSKESIVRFETSFGKRSVPLRRYYNQKTRM